MTGGRIARLYIVRGSVQGVGYRYFVRRTAGEMQIGGTVRNLDDGTVEVIALGTKEQQASLLDKLHIGPAGAEVQGIEERDTPMQQYSSFTIVR